MGDGKTRLYNGGKFLLDPSGKLAVNADCCCEDNLPPCPCANAGPGQMHWTYFCQGIGGCGFPNVPQFKTDYYIQNYAQHPIGGIPPTQCQTCDAAPNGSPLWDGGFHAFACGGGDMAFTVPECSWWAAWYCGSPDTWVNINGRKSDVLEGAYCYITSGTGTPFWWMVIMCSNAGLNATNMWTGKKKGGTDPTGQYLRVSGCDTAGARTII